MIPHFSPSVNRLHVIPLAKREKLCYNMGKDLWNVSEKVLSYRGSREDTE